MFISVKIFKDTGTPSLTRFSYSTEFHLTRFFSSPKTVFNSNSTVITQRNWPLAKILSYVLFLFTAIIQQLDLVFVSCNLLQKLLANRNASIMMMLPNLCAGTWTMDMWWVFFSKMSQIIGTFGQMGRINCGVFGVFPVELSAHIL